MKYPPPPLYVAHILKSDKDATCWIAGYAHCNKSIGCGDFYFRDADSAKCYDGTPHLRCCPACLVATKQPPQ